MSCFKRVTGGDKQNDTEERQKTLDMQFWKDRAVLKYLDRFDDSGNIAGLDHKAAAGKGAGDGGAGAADGGNKESDEVAIMELQQPINRDLNKIFKKAHMEIASQMCRNVTADQGAGVCSWHHEQHHHHHHEKDAQEQ